MSFFTDIKQKEVSSETTHTTRAECNDMVVTQRCSAGHLNGGNGVYITDNPTNAEYVYCCKKNTFSADQCSYIEAAVYKRHGTDKFESTAGDVSHCSYEDKACVLNDDSVLIWKENKETYCEFEEWYKMEGTFYDAHFVSKDQGMALTFHQYGLNNQQHCRNNITSLSDQGLMIRFLTPLENVTIKGSTKDVYSIEGVLSDDLALTKALVQVLAYDQAKMARELFWSAYYYSCHNAAETLRIISMLLEQHPITSARYLLQMSNITARSGPGFLQVFPCTIVDPAFYKMLPMDTNNCTDYLPMSITLGGTTRVGYLNPKDNIIHTESFSVNCRLKYEVLVRLNGTTQVYYPNGTLGEVENFSNLSVPNIKLGAEKVHIHEAIFSKAHRLNWGDFSDHHSLNHLLATLNRQQQVLEAMGVMSTQHHTLEKNVIESKEGILGGSYFAFLFGGHVASGWELWTLGVEVIVTIGVTLYVMGCVWKKCCLPRYQTYRGRAEVVAVNADLGDSDSESGDETETRGQAPSYICPPSRRTQLTTTEEGYGLQRYNNLYPQLPIVEGQSELKWPSFYRPPSSSR